jgi:hypothetical protein
MDIKNEVRGSHSGQLDQTLYIEDGDKTIAYLDYSEYHGTPHVQYLWVSDDQRRNGLGAALIRKLQSLHPNEEIDFGGLTDGGAALINSLQFKKVSNPYLTRVSKMLTKVKAKLAALQNASDDEKKKAGESGVWNKLYDMENKLEEILRGQTIDKRIVSN